MHTEVHAEGGPETEGEFFFLADIRVLKKGLAKTAVKVSLTEDDPSHEHISATI